MKSISRAVLFLVLILSVAFTGASAFGDSRAAEKREREREKKREKESIQRKAENRAGAKPKRAVRGEELTRSDDDPDTVDIPGNDTPVELTMIKGGSSSADLRSLPPTRPKLKEREEREFERELGPMSNPSAGVESNSFVPRVVSNAPMPSPAANFLGLDFLNWGAGRPPDTVGDVGPNHYIQAVNTSIGIYSKAGAQLAAFTFDTFMSQGNFGNLCDTDNFGDPVILYDTFEDRWIITDFAFQLDGGGNVVSPPGAFQCFAVSKTGDPVSGGWNFYSIHITDNLNDYPKFGIWPDGLYMSSNMFGFPSTGSFVGTRVWALNKAQMYAGEANVKVVQFSPPAGEFTLLPANARLQTGTPPPGSPNYFATVGFTNSVTIYKFHVDWNSVSLSTFTGPFQSSAATFTVGPDTVPAMGGNANDTLATRLMMQNQYANIGGVESVWDTITVRHPTTANVAAPRWFQVNVTGGTVAAATVQAATHAPDTTNRYMGSLAVDRAGDMALGYSASSATLIPAIRYAGRLAGDAVNTLPQTETSLVEGTGSQNTSTRWGDYSAMSLDPTDGCTFWFTNEYYITTGGNWQTRVGSFAFPTCTPVTTGTLEGTVTVNPGGAPIAGAIIQLGARSTTTNGSGFYQFASLPAGTYPTLTATKPGYVTGTATSVVINSGATTTQNFALTASAPNACITDTTQADFLMGTATNTDVNTSPGDVTLLNAANPDQQNLSVTGNGFGVTATAWVGQTFQAGVTGNLTRVDLDIFCSGCTGTTPNLTVSIRATTGTPALPTGADLGSATIPGFNSAAGGFFTASFATPVALVSGTRYAIVLRPTANPSAGTYAYVCSCTANTNPYANGQRVTSANSGGTWTADTTAGGRDLGFIAYVKTGFPTNGTYVSTNRDSNPLAGLTPIWSSLSWTATTPANTGLQFQVAASNSPLGPFTFVGPDGTAATFFTTSPAALTQFYNQRYVQYKAFLASTLSTATPTVNDVTMCFNDVDCSGASAAITPTPAQVCPNSTGNTASGPAGMTSYAWSITNGTITSATNIQSITYTAGASGNVTLSLAVIAPSGCQPSSNTNVPIVSVPTPTATPGGPTTFCTGGSVTITSTSATGNQWYDGVTLLAGQTNQTYVATTAGNYNVVVTQSGCASAPSNSVAVTVTPPPPTPTATPGGPTTFCAGGSVTLTSSSATGNQWYDGVTLLVGQTNQTYVATTSGNYNVVVTSGCPSAPSSSVAVTVNPAPPTPTATPGGPTTFCAGGSVTLTSSSATGNQWYDGVTLLVGQTNQTYVATATGNYNVVVTQSGCPSAPSSSVAVTVNPIPPTPTATPGGPTTFCAGGSVTLTSSSATGNQWYDGVTLLVGQTNQTYVATATGNYNVVVTQSGCASAPSSSVAVTVNPAPATPTATPGGPTTFCAGGSVTLTSSSATGNQWYDGVTLLVGQTNQTYVATTSGNYNVVVTSGCPSAPSSSVAVTVNPAPATPTATPGGPTTFCAGGSVTLTSSSATGNQWYDGVTLLVGQTNQTYVATATGNYNVVVTQSGCASAPSSSVAVTVNPAPATPTATPGGPTTFCTGGSVTLTSSSATGNQWYDGVTLLAGQTNQTYVATATGNYNVVVTQSGCASAPSSSVAVTVNPAPPTPTITPSGPTTFCAGGSVTLTSSSASGNQWYLNGNPIGGEVNQQYIATASGDYTVVVTTSGCSSSASATTQVLVNPLPNAAITAPGSMQTATSSTASVADAGVGATYVWSVGGGSLDSGQNTNSIGFTGGAVGTLTINVTVTSATTCSASGSASVTVTPGTTVTVTNVSPNSGTISGGSSVTITGTSFVSGATVSFGGNPATSVVVVNSTTITAVTPAHAAGAVNVTVTNPDTSNGSLTNGYTYLTQQFDANNDGVVDPADIFYLVNYLFSGGPTPAGPAGLMSGDANGDNVVDPADIFYVINYLYLSGPAPMSVNEPIRGTRLTGAITLGRPTVRNGHTFVPVSVKAGTDSIAPRALSLKLSVEGGANIVAVRRAGAVKDVQPTFEITRMTRDGAAYLVAVGAREDALGGVVAEIQIDSASPARVTIDRSLTMLTDVSGRHVATAANGALQLSAPLTIDRTTTTKERAQ